MNPMMTEGLSKDTDEHIYTSFFYDSFFGGSTLLVIVPHQDDEVNTAGATIVGAIQEGLDVHVAYMTNGDWDYDIPLRNHEAINACNVLGVPRDNIHFLGYQIVELMSILYICIAI